MKNFLQQTKNCIALLTLILVITSCSKNDKNLLNTANQKVIFNFDNGTPSGEYYKSEEKNNIKISSFEKNTADAHDENIRHTSSSDFSGITVYSYNGLLIDLNQFNISQHKIAFKFKNGASDTEVSFLDTNDNVIKKVDNIAVVSCICDPYQEMNTEIPTATKKIIIDSYTLRLNEITIEAL
ncbi:hypothetical protein [Tenacibaculum amylolyticum]|uniref:hypothetical protein n=1 Tax=Tenacibaculum amylolyticum TaxID=104269 RepID=UPI00389507B3